METEGTAETTSESVQEAVSEVEAVSTEDATSAETTPSTDPFDDEKVETFDRAYVEKLRNEAASKRTELTKFKETFKDWPSEAVEGFLGLAKAIESGDAAAVPVLENLLSQLSPKEQEAVLEAITEQAEEPPKTLTAEEVEKMLEEREASKEAERLQEDNFKALKTEIEGLGYNLDAPNEEANLLFFYAQSQDGDVKDFQAAHKKVEAFRQGIIDSFVEKAAGKNSRFAKHAAAAGLTPTGVDGGTNKLSLSDGSARKAMAEFLASAD